ncbi:MAG: hypothetical protein ACQEQH_08470 [Bacillota bacterium]
MIKLNKKKIIILATIVIIAATNAVFSQNYLDLSTFHEVNGGYWYLGQDNSSVKQIQDINESIFYLLNQELINKTITGTIKVDSTTYQDDQFGLVFGYQDINDTYVWSWDAGGVHGTEGHVFYYKNRTINNLEIPGDILYDKREPGLAWEKDVNYHFKAVYLENSFKLYLNEQLIIDYKGELPPGKFGFFCYTQDLVNFSNIEIKDASDKLRPPLEELDTPIHITGGIISSSLNSDNIAQSSYQLSNTSKYDLDNLYLLVELDKNFSLIKESVVISKQDTKIKYLKNDNILKVDNVSLKKKENLQLSFYLQKLSSYGVKDNYVNKLSVYSNKGNILLSEQLNTEHKANKLDIDLSSLIIGRVKINNKEDKNKKYNKTSFQIITSDGRIIKTDKDGRFHLVVDNFNNFYDQEILTLKLIIEDNKKYKIKGNKIKLIKIKPAQLIRKDFKLYLGGKGNE